MLLANGLSTFPIKGNQIFSNGPKNLPKNFHDCCILCNWAFDSFISAENFFSKALRSFETYFLLWKLFSSLESPTTFG